MLDKLKGTGVALVTPFREDGKIDYVSYERLLDYTVKGGIDFLVINGTTGESPTLEWDEKLILLELAQEKLKDTIPIVFGHGGNNTGEILEKMKDIKSFNLAAILSVSPYYNKPSQEGIILHYETIADACPFPVILYNVPARTSSNLAVATTLHLASHPNIIGIKEATDDVKQIAELMEKRPQDFMVFSGDDKLAFKLAKMGAEGSISVAANYLPGLFSLMIRAVANGEIIRAERIAKDIRKVLVLLTKEGNPVSVKAALTSLDLCKPYVRLPLVKASDELIQTFVQFKKWVY